METVFQIFVVLYVIIGLVTFAILAVRKTNSIRNSPLKMGGQILGACIIWPIIWFVYYKEGLGEE